MHFIGKYQLFVTNLKTNYCTTNGYAHKILTKRNILSNFLRYIYSILMQFQYNIFYFYKIILLDTHKLRKMLTSSLIVRKINHKSYFVFFFYCLDLNLKKKLIYSL